MRDKDMPILRVFITEENMTLQSITNLNLSWNRLSDEVFVRSLDHSESTHNYSLLQQQQQQVHL